MSKRTVRCLIGTLVPIPSTRKKIDKARERVLMLADMSAERRNIGNEISTGTAKINAEMN